MIIRTPHPFPCLGAATTRCLALPILALGLGLTLAAPVKAQTLRTIHTFTGQSTGGSNYDGANPYGGLVQAGNTLYGTTEFGGTSSNGTVFAVNTDGTGFSTLHSFTGGSDGGQPFGALILVGNTLYGTTPDGGTTSGTNSGGGTLFAVNTDGTGFTTLHSFTKSDGWRPLAGLALSGNTFYGVTTMGDGIFDYGTIFAVNTDGSGFTVLYRFSASLFYEAGGPVLQGGLLLSGNTLYGTTPDGDSAGTGTIYALGTDGTGFTNLYDFPGNSTSPVGALILSGSTLYGTTKAGGTVLGENGTVFAINTNGSSFTILHSLGPPPKQYLPVAGLLLSGNTLYGTTPYGGSSALTVSSIGGFGIVFAVNTDGTGFTTLYNFTGGSDGGNPQAGLILSGNALYGTAMAGGNSRKGTVFSLTFAPQLTIALSGPNVILTWPTNFAGFDYTGYTLQSTTDLTPPAVWTPVSTAPVLVNAQYTVTNPISGSQQFYRLTQ
jgi:uncharacterized repeat protein (TIGR03803 family)